MSENDPQPDVPSLDSHELTAPGQSSDPATSSSTLCQTGRPHWLAALQPGHWLLLIFLVGSLLQIVGWSVFAVVYDLTFSRTGGGDTVWAWLACNAFYSPVVAVFLVVAAVRLRDGWAWTILFAVRALGAGVMAIASAFAMRVWLEPALFDADAGWHGYHILHGPTGLLADMALWFPPLFSVIVFVLLVTAVVLDIPRLLSRNWVHWLGVCCLAVGNPIATYYWFGWVFGGTVGQMFGK
jgi:hypothetical protein